MAQIINLQAHQDIDIEELAKREGWDIEEDTDTVVLDMNDMTDVADGYELIMMGLKKIEEATGVGLPDWEQIC